MLDCNDSLYIDLNNMELIKDVEKINLEILNEDNTNEDNIKYQILINKILTFHNLKSLKITLVDNYDITPLLLMNNLEIFSFDYYGDEEIILGSIKQLINLTEFSCNIDFNKNDLLELPKLRKLNVPFNNDDSNIISKITQIEHLIIKGSIIEINFDELLLIKSISNLINLTSLYLNLNFLINYEFMFYLLKLTNLTSLNNQYLNITDENVKYLSKLNKFKKIKLECEFIYIYHFKDVIELYLSHSNIIDEDLSIIPNLKYLNYLDISGCKNITSKGFYYIGQSTSIEKLDYSFIEIDDNCIIHLKNLPLKNINIKYTKLIISRFFHECIDSVLYNNIEEISFEYNNISDNDVFYILKIPNLKELNLSFCNNITNKIIKIIGKYGNNLIKLSLSHCQINDDGLLLFTKFNFHLLEHLDLSSNVFSDNAFKNFDKLKMKNLTKLDIGFCTGFTIKGLQILRSSNLCKSIKLYLEYINIDGVYKLFKDVNVFYGDGD